MSIKDLIDFLISYDLTRLCCQYWQPIPIFIDNVVAPLGIAILILSVILWCLAILMSAYQDLKQRHLNKKLEQESSSSINHSKIEERKPILYFSNEIVDNDFRAKHPFVQFNIPLNIREQFIQECQWLESKLGHFPSYDEQKTILIELGAIEE